MVVLLDEAHPGDRVHVLPDRQPSTALTRRLAEMGLRAGTVLHILSRTSGGGAILAIGDDRIAVSRAILRAIEVSPGAEPAVGRG